MSRDTQLAQVLLDLDRCIHGRHPQDPCFSCPSGQSAGNPHLRPGQVIGYGLSGVPITVPDRDRGQHPANPQDWFTRPS